MPDKDYSLSNTPRAGSDDVGTYFWRLYEEAREEKERLNIPDRLMASYAAYRGNVFGRNGIIVRGKTLGVNLFFSNVQRTVANITAKNPVAEVVDADGQRRC